MGEAWIEMPLPSPQKGNTSHREGQKSDSGKGQEKKKKKTFLSIMAQKQ